ncbi:GH1 family beta-glucosidase [Actinoplanes sp. Pm04-4]|uniref:Beta-glucosidase n=1 Tax=Paractinoplanes pyxinae TaxID=2997416 RepID=A0ABT4AVK9_9ACTN|nr:GH1 family beta-glucosidase [Actinoplanes pyxinae]MCY1138247.1 GH1 family beta-glucosidase [Actinoplanes pyxinae]
MVDPLPRFPDGFLFGCSTASYQIEGAVTEDGRGPSIWDTFSHTDGKTLNGDTGDVACDHYHRYPEDVALLADLGVGAYRFSIAWPRVQPTGSGVPSRTGLDFYDRLVDALLEKGVVPVPTLFHWDLPQALEDKGGWLTRDTASYFSDYTSHVVTRLGDRVRRWITLNEPVVHMAQGYAYGTHAPGRTLMLDALPVAHHQLLGHGLAARALRAAGAAEVMITNNCTPVWPAGEDAGDVTAAAMYDAFHNRLFNDPVLLGSYPDFLAAALGDLVREGDLEVISTPLDALGINYYNPTQVGAPAEGSPLPFDPQQIEGYPTTAFGWPVVPSGLTDLLTGLRETYGDALPPIHITENGCSTAAGVQDQFRIDYLDAHLRAVHDAITAGVDVRGYFVWSLLDNFEWAEGYSQRFGLVEVDFETLSRTPRESYRWLRSALEAQAASPR